MQTKHVTNTKELLEAIGPDCTIILTNRSYTINGVEGPISKYCRFEKDEFGIIQLIIQDVTNLTFQNSDSSRVKIESNLYSDIIQLKNCSNIKLFNIQFEHLYEGCRGYALTIQNSAEITISNCILEGGKSDGLTLIM